MSTDLAAWLLERIAEDETSARAVLGDYANHREHWEEEWSGAVNTGDEDLLLTNDSTLARHIVRWDPARVLAECTAKRSVVERWQEDNAAADEAWKRTFDRDLGLGADGLLIAVQLLAVPYADRPGYHEEWRP